MILRPGGRGRKRQAEGCGEEAFTYAGLPLEQVSSLKYLGLTFAQLSPQLGYAACADVMADAGRRAMFSMRRRARELGACSVEQQSLLFDVFVRPVLSYGCEVWGVDQLLRADVSSERVHRWFCRRVQGLPTQVSSAVALAELGRWPLHLFWVQQLVRFWNRLLSIKADAEPDCLLRSAFEDNLSLMREGADLAAGSPCWSRKWFSFLQSAPTDSGTMVWLTPLREGDIVERATAAYLRRAMESQQVPSTAPQQHTPSVAPQPAAEHDGGRAPTVAHRGAGGVGGPLGPPRPVSGVGSGAELCPLTHLLGPSTRGAGNPPTQSSPPASDSAHSNKFSYYLTHICGTTQPLGGPAPHLLTVTDYRHRISLSRFRTSCHDLRIERERHLPEAIKAPRHERTCLVCASDSLEDESHALFHCPLYDELRWEYADLFSPQQPQSTTLLLSHNQTRVASYIHSASILRHRSLTERVRPCAQ